MRTITQLPPLDEQTQALVADAIKHAYQVAHRLPGPFDENLSAAFEALCRLASAYQPTHRPEIPRSTAFGAYLQNGAPGGRLYARTIDMLRSERGRHQGALARLPALRLEHPEIEGTLADMLSSTVTASAPLTPEEAIDELEDIAQQLEQQRRLHGYIECLPPKLARILIATYFDGRGQCEIARDPSIFDAPVSDSRVSQVLSQAEAQLADLLTRYPSGPPGPQQNPGRRRRHCEICRTQLPLQYGRGHPAKRCEDCRG